VLGAGLQGLCAAYALADRGWRVGVLDQAAAPLDRASGRNEGKVHLGLTYANDPSFDTQALMLRCGLAFGPLIERWCGPQDWAGMTSTPFEYVVMRDSLVPMQDLTAMYDRLACRFDAVRHDGVSYLGRALEWLIEPPVPVGGGGRVSVDLASHTARTQERTLDLGTFRRAVSLRLSHDARITFRAHRRVEGVARRGHGFIVQGVDTGTGAGWQAPADIVVNCLWEGRRRIDDTVGVGQGPPQMYRLNYRILGQMDRVPPGTPSYTLVLGRYGDLVINPSGLHYFSWYPVCMTDAAVATAAPESWEAALSTSMTAEAARCFAAQAVAALARVLPMARCARVVHVDAGVICAAGESDIDDPASGLHRRAAIGVAAYDGYFSIDTGKLTCAPAFADTLGEMVEGL
jgi:hypothetical protein